MLGLGLAPWIDVPRILDPPLEPPAMNLRLAAPSDRADVLVPLVQPNRPAPTLAVADAHQTLGDVRALAGRLGCPVAQGHRGQA